LEQLLEHYPHEKGKSMTLANWLTVLRIVLIPVFIGSLIYRYVHWSLLAFCLAALTDALDGFVARKTKITSLGRFLDPLADKMLLASAFVILPIVNQVPVWVTVVVVSRDVTIALGYLLIYINWGSSLIKVRILGKITTLLQSCCVGFSILAMILPVLEPFNTYFIYVVAGVTALSGIDYVVLGIKHANELAAVKETTNYKPLA
jgi:cardiolipin synthase (CMP-forming)